VLDLFFGRSITASAYTDEGCLNKDTFRKVSPAAEAAQMRDAYVCQYCGFQSRKYQGCVGGNTEIAEDLVTACIFCAQVLSVDLVPQMRSGVLIWLPELTQAALNRGMPEIYTHRIDHRSETPRARVVLDSLLARREGAKVNLGSDDPTKLVEQLREDSAGSQAGHELMRNGLRLLPLDRRILREGRLEFNQFPQILAYWRSREGPLSTTSTHSLDYFENALVTL
jgi:intracellular multiplication protein IcmJ